MSILASNQSHNIPLFSISQAVSNLQSTANSFHASDNAHASTSGTAFRAPAHKHAHHLHSIPPREKSTRTLIIDHMLWVHGRTRFAQARAELGMTDRTGGPSSSNYQHRYRPENYEEEDEIASDGEDVEVLKARSSPHDEDEETRLRRQDLPLARNLRLRAEGLEKVVTSMLVQLPPVNPIIDDDLDDPPTSPNAVSSASSSRPQHQHTLPNGVRLRLALATVINDLFSRQTPPQPYRHKASSPSTSRETPNEETTSEEAGPSSSFLPPALSLLSPVSAYSRSHPHHDFSLARDYVQSQHTPSSSRTERPSKPNARVRAFYQSGADPDTANSPPGLRCPRHLHTSCEICVEAKSNLRPLSVSGHKQPNPGSMGPPGTSFVNGTGSTWNSWKGTPIGIAPDGGGVSGWQDGGGIGSGLLKPGIHGTVLRRKSRDGGIPNEGNSSNGRGITKLSELIPRFLRLSALVAAELGREVREAREVEGALVDSGESSDSEDEGDGGGGDGEGGVDGATSDARAEGSRSASRAQLHNRSYLHALRPSREWYLLLAGLLTRAALQGYLSAGWRGTDAVECLMTIGLGIRPDTGVEDPDAEWEGFEPDELPNLIDSVRMLFPTGMSKTHAAEEYEAEMNERLRKFIDIPLSTPDLSTHMEDLAWQYPAEAIERAAVRFCEAMAKWRGTPELETYKKKPSNRKPPEPTSDELTMTIESLVHSNPSSPSGPHLVQRTHHHKRKPIIELYFLQPTDANHHLSSPLQPPSTGYPQPPPQFLSPSSVDHTSSVPTSIQSLQNIPSGMTPAMLMGTRPSTWDWTESSSTRGSTKRPHVEEDLGNSSKRYRGS